MPIKKSAIKALRQDKKKSLKNFKVKNAIKDAVKKSQKLIKMNEKDAASKKVKETIKKIDKAIQNKTIKKNTGARKKSRLMKKLNSLGK